MLNVTVGVFNEVRSYICQTTTDYNSDDLVNAPSRPTMAWAVTILFGTSTQNVQRYPLLC